MSSKNHNQPNRAEVSKSSALTVGSPGGRALPGPLSGPMDVEPTTGNPESLRAEWNSSSVSGTFPAKPPLLQEPWRKNGGQGCNVECEANRPQNQGEEFSAGDQEGLAQ